MQRELRDKSKLSKVKRLTRTATEAKLYIQRRRKPRQNTMAVVCYINPTVSSSGCLVGNKRLYSETEESSESEEDSTTMSRHCQAVWNSYKLPVPHVKTKIPRMIDAYLAVFLNLFDDETIQDFLWVDSCAKIADRYLLAMIYIYFRRAGLTLEQYNRFNFFVALYLANDMEEDDEDEKYEIFPWALGKEWKQKYPVLLLHRDQLWKNMGFRAVVSRRLCDEVISLIPDHRVWKRHRLPHHGGAFRSYMKPSTPKYERSSPQYCKPCTLERQRYQERLVRCSSLPPTSFNESVTTGYSWHHQKLDLLDEIDFEFKETHYISGTVFTEKGESLNDNFPNDSSVSCSPVGTSSLAPPTNQLPPLTNHLAPPTNYLQREE